MKTVEVLATSILTPQKVGSLAGSYQYSLNPYAGCAFSCSYCYVPKFPSRRHSDFQDWGKWLEIKINAPDLIRKERTKVFGSSIFFSSATDPYQYAELKYRLSRKCLEQLLLYKPAKITMHTRSHLILQDLALLKRFGDVLRVGVSITTDKEEVRKEFEPKAPTIARRIELIKTLSNEGIRVHASIAPLLPCNPERLVQLIKPYVEDVWIDSMRYQEVNTRKELLDKYEDFFQKTNQTRIKETIIAQFSKKNSFNRRTVKNRAPQSGHQDNQKSRQLTFSISSL